MGKTTSMPPLPARTALGDVRGVVHYGPAHFRGVPYAMPPLGEQRFRPPQPAGAWQGELDATAHGPIAPQGPSRLSVAVGGSAARKTEYCLTLTITTKTKGSSRKKIPRRPDPACPHEQESRRDATTTGQAPAQAGV
jgi:carboxylesterase type B